MQDVMGITPESLQRVIELIPAPVFVISSDGMLADCNRAFLDFFSLDETVKGGAIAGLLPEVLVEHLTGIPADFTAPAFLSFEMEFTAPGHRGHKTARIQLCRYGASGMEGSVGIVFDVTEDTRRVDRLRQLSILDELTALPNRRHGLERVQNLLQQSRRNEFSFGFLIIDIDNFKSVNDYEGHQAGDVVLRDIADIIQKLCRSYDLAFRYGGDEIIVCLPNTRLVATTAFAERIRNAVASHQVQLPDGTHIRTVSIGIACFPDHGQTLEALLDAADAALRSAKQGGRNQVVVTEGAEPSSGS